MSNMTEMTITEALRRKNLIDLSILGDRKKRTNSILVDKEFISIRKKGSVKNTKGKEITEVRKTIQGNFDSIKGKLHNRYAIDSAIKMSNATTTIMIGETKYTMAEAIEYEKSHTLELEVLKHMENQYKNAQSLYLSQEESIDRKIQEQKTALLGSGLESSTIEQSLRSIATVEDKNRYELIDPKGLSDFIVERKSKLEEFLFEVNDAKNTSNALTKITVELA